MSYAQSTSVSVERSKAEIEKLLKKYGASQFAYKTGEDGAVVGFAMMNKMIRFDLPIRGIEYFSSETKHAQETRQRWRALLLCIKAKLESVEVGICSFEEEFIAQIILPNGRTFGEEMIPQIDKIYESKKVPLLLGE